MGDGTEQNPYTREDVLRLIKKNGGKAKGLDLSGKTFADGIDLSKVDLSGIILKNAQCLPYFWVRTMLGVYLEEDVLSDVDPEEARLSGAHLERARLLNAHLEEAFLPFSHFDGSDLSRAHLEGADLSFAHFEGACLVDAHLEGARLTGAHLEGTALGLAHLEGAFLGGAKFSADTKLEDVDWGNYILGEEKNGAYRLASDTYRRLKLWYTEHGMYEVAGKFFYREMEAKRKTQSWKRKPHLKLWGWAMRLLCGYGERPWQVVLWGLLVLFGLALLYFFLRGVAPYTLTAQTFLSSLYYSAVSFTALGYGPWFSASSVCGWAQGVGAAEAIIGVFMIALFLVTFVRKMTR